MVDFIREQNDPEARGINYIYNFPLFKDIADQSGISGSVPDGWISDTKPEDSELTFSPEENFRYHYTQDGKSLLVIKNVFITISGKGITTEKFDLFNNPGVVRLSVKPATLLKYDYEDELNIPEFYVVEILLNNLPADSVNYLIEVIGDNGKVALSEKGTFNIIDAP